MHVNLRYLLWKAEQLKPDGTILDYGCGAAETVQRGRESGLNIWGADVFHQRTDDMKTVEEKDCWVTP
jgi:cyclopropane fatty-acyl-phospholipid synthase-like methyltransferase